MTIEAKGSKLRVDSMKAQQRTVLERLAKIKKVSGLVANMLKSREMSLNAIKDYLESIQRGLLYGVNNLYSPPKMAKYVYKSLDNWARGIVKKASGISKSSPSQGVLDAWGLSPFEELHQRTYMEQVRAYIEKARGGDLFSKSILKEGSYYNYAIDLAEREGIDTRIGNFANSFCEDVVSKRSDIAAEVRKDFQNMRDFRNPSRICKVLAVINNRTAGLEKASEWWKYKTDDEICRTHNCVREMNHIACN